MATTTHRRITRKELRQPDEFVSFVDRAGEFVANNLARVVAGAIGLLIVVLAIVGTRFYLDHQERLAAEAFYQGSQSFERRDYKTAITRFTTLANDYSHSDPGRLAHLYLGNAWLALKEPAKARDEFQKYLANSSAPAFHDLALMQLGVAQEDLGKYDDARKAYQQAAAIKGPEQGRAELNAARVLARQGDKKGAIASYQQFLRENPFSQERGAVIDLLAQLGAAPATPSFGGRTIEIPQLPASH